MINRKEIKAAAKNLIHTSYWKNVGAGILLSLATATGAAYAASQVVQAHANPEVMEKLHHLVSSADPAALAVAAGIIIAGGAVAGLTLSLIKKLVTLPLEVGCKGYFLKHRDGESRLSKCFSGFTGNFGNVFTTMLVRDIKIALWSLLFTVPGIVKAYEYKMVPYLLAQNPDMDRREAFAQSKALMKGHKMDAFKLDLSFLGWGLLGVCTFGLVNLFYTTPYKAAADTEFFENVCAAA